MGSLEGKTTLHISQLALIFQIRLGYVKIYDTVKTVYFNFVYIKAQQIGCFLEMQTEKTKETVLCVIN